MEIEIKDPPISYDTLSGKDIGVAKSTLSKSIQCLYRMLEKLGEQAFIEEALQNQMK